MVDLTQRWLHGRVRSMREWRDAFPGEPLDEQLTKALAGVEALVVAGALPAEAAPAWERRLRTVAAGDEDVPAPSAACRDAAAALLEAALERLPAGIDPPFDDQQRFEGALHVLAVAGAVDAAAWDARFRERVGWPSDEEERRAEDAVPSGAATSVVAVHPGSGARHAGRRAVLVVRFSGAVHVDFDRDEDHEDAVEWPEWELSDDAGTRYWAMGGSAGGTSEHATFEPAPPAHATRLELRLEGSADPPLVVELA
jgi:hypothetical protein